jgi:ABC-2 type transport system ATP-binding protein
MADVCGDLSQIEHRVLQTQGMIEIATDDVNATLRSLGEQVSGLTRLRIRQPNLEDLFLALTGHSLRA